MMEVVLFKVKEISSRSVESQNTNQKMAIPFCIVGNYLAPFPQWNVSRHNFASDGEILEYGAINEAKKYNILL